MRTLILSSLLSLSQIVNAGSLEGTYKGRGHYGDIKITERGPEYLIETCGYYNPHCFQIRAVLDQDQKEQHKYISTSGSIVVYYVPDSSLRCSYEIEMQITHDPEKDTIYISEHGPGLFPSTWRGITCPEEKDLNFSDYVETEPYVKDEQQSQEQQEN